MATKIPAALMSAMDAGSERQGPPLWRASHPSHARPNRRAPLADATLTRHRSFLTHP
jgi:hypothetical protein